MELVPKAKMNKSARNGTGDYCSNEFDYQTDFTQILEEARKNTTHVTFVTNFEGIRKNEKKSTRSLKNSLFSWLKTDKKRKSTKEPTKDTSLVSKTRRGHVSGPIEPTVGVISRSRRAASGPLIGFMNSKMPEEYEVPYMCLENPHKLQSYGPIYLVT